MNARQLFAAFLHGERVALQNESLAPISMSVYRKLLQAYGRTPYIVGFFDIYGELKDLFESGENPGGSDLFIRFKRGVSYIDSRIDLESTRNRFEEVSEELSPILRRIDNGWEPSPTFWRRVIELYSDLIQAAGADKGVYSSTRRLPGQGAIRWLRLQRSSAKEEAMESLRRDDPDLYHRMQMDKRQRDEINDNIKARIEADGLEPGVRVIANRPVMVGIGPAHGVNGQYDMMVYDIDGEVLPVPDFVEKLSSKKRENSKLQRINPADWMWYDSLDDLRQADMDALGPELANAPEEFVSLTDDTEKESSLTRIYKVKTLSTGEQVVISGRFKGFFVSDLVNAVGRQVEGSIFYLDPHTNRTSRREVLDSEGKVQVRDQAEPYVTLTKDGRLFLRISNKKPYAVVRRAVRELAKTIPSIYEPLPKQRPYLTRWYFDPKDFALIKDRIGSMALSNAAAKFLKDYFAELSKAELASQSKNLSRYSNESLGFKPDSNRQIRNHVKKALAWLDANGNRGICALDTGMGKTVVAIAAMMNLTNKGVADAGNGRFLFVGPKSLKGNLPKEIFKFLPEEDAQALIDRVDVMDYRTFRKMRRKARVDPEDPNSSTWGDDYVAIFFDEAHEELNSRSKASYREAVGVQCEHKVLLTASPMARSPKEVFAMASVGNMEDLNTPEGRKDEKLFFRQFTSNVGGRITGITDNEESAHTFRVWVKRNLFFLDKRDVEEPSAQLAETGLGASGRDLARETLAVTMPPAIEDAYRATMDQLMVLLKQWEGWSKFEGNAPLGIDTARNKRDIAALLKRLTSLSDTPDEVIPGVGNPKLDEMVLLLEKNLGQRTLVFAESDKLVQSAYSRMRAEFPGQGIVAGFANHILYYTPAGEEILIKRNGWKNRTKEQQSLDQGDITSPRRYKPIQDPNSGRVLKTKREKEGWATFALEKMLGLGTKQHAQRPVMAAVLSGKYAVGQNLQSFGTVVHLDRDSWNSETMKQRTARAWRAGNKQPVDEYTLDMVFPDAVEPDDADMSLDEIREVIQNIDAELFDRVVLDSQIERLGEEWISIKKQRSALHVIDRKMLARAVSPYAGPMGRSDEDPS
jgi:hypothetical protein